jgi:membrane protein involved in colicin uptake
VGLAILLHGALLAALVYGWMLFRSPPRPAPTLAIEASVVDARTVAGRQRPAPPAPPPVQETPPEPQGPPAPSPEERAEREKQREEQRQKAEAAAEAEKASEEQAAQYQAPWATSEGRRSSSPQYGQ